MTPATPGGLANILAATRMLGAWDATLNQWGSAAPPASNGADPTARPSANAGRCHHRAGHAERADARRPADLGRFRAGAEPAARQSARIAAVPAAAPATADLAGTSVQSVLAGRRPGVRPATTSTSSCTVCGASCTTPRCCCSSTTPELRGTAEPAAHRPRPRTGRLPSRGWRPVRMCGR